MSEHDNEDKAAWQLMVHYFISGYGPSDDGPLPWPTRKPDMEMKDNIIEGAKSVGIYSDESDTAVIQRWAERVGWVLDGSGDGAWPWFDTVSCISHNPVNERADLHALCGLAEDWAREKYPDLKVVSWHSDCRVWNEPQHKQPIIAEHPDPAIARLHALDTLMEHRNENDS